MARAVLDALVTMKASETMTRSVIVVPPELPLRRAWQVLQRHHIRHLPVTRGGRLLGIVSDRDVLLRATLRSDGTIEVPDEPVAVAMTAQPVTCEPTATVAQLVRLMTERKIDAVPIVRDEGRMVGLVTSTDLLLLLIDFDEAKPLPFEFHVLESDGASEALA